MSKRGQFGRRPLDAAQHGEDVDSAEVEALYAELAALESGGEIVPTNGGALALGGWQMTPVGLVAPDNLTQGEYENFGRALMRLDMSMQWLIGDYINTGDNFQWGETYYQLASEFGYEVSTLKDYAYVARQVQMSVRTDNLSFTHHKIVTAMDTDEQDDWLRTAAANGWSASQFRAEIKHANQPAPQLHEGATFEGYKDFNAGEIVPPRHRGPRPSSAPTDSPTAPHVPPPGETSLHGNSPAGHYVTDSSEFEEAKADNKAAAALQAEVKSHHGQWQAQSAAFDRLYKAHRLTVFKEPIPRALKSSAMQEARALMDFLEAVQHEIDNHNPQGES